MEVYITSIVQEIAQKDKGEGLSKAIERLRGRLEKASIDIVHPSVMERIGFLFSRNGKVNFELWGNRFLYIDDKQVPVMVIWQIFSRGGKEYSEFIEVDKSKRETVCKIYA